MVTAGVADGFATFTVPLVIEGEAGLGRTIQLLVGAVKDVELAEADGARDVFEAQRSVVMGLAIFPRVEEIKERNPSHILMTMVDDHFDNLERGQ